MKKVLVYQKRDNLKPTGGPAAIGYYYATEKEKRNDNYFEYVRNSNSFNGLHNSEESIIAKMPKWMQNFYYKLKQILKYNILLGGKYRLDYINFNKYDIVHFHDTQGLYLRRYDLEDYKGKIILQSHSPQPLGQEMYEALPKSVSWFIPFAKKRFEIMDKYAFGKADYIIFPCPDAEEPYYKRWKLYEAIHNNKNKSYRYLLTGIPQSVPKRDRLQIRTEIAISETDFIICYVGRHNKIKGYDLLKNIGKEFLSNNPDAWIVCAGKEAPLTRLEHPRWKEIGWTTDAHSYIAAADVFILPNRETYFDIVMLEVLSLGKIVIASRTGGNKYFEKEDCEGVLLYDTENEAIRLLDRVKSMSESKRNELGQKNKDFYEKYHTVSAMYDRYIKLLTEISEENNNGKVNQS